MLDIVNILDESIEKRSTPRGGPVYVGVFWSSMNGIEDDA
jgi:hypothetical protein